MVSEQRICVVVLGDLGRSPRMQYHCRSLCRLGVAVDFVGYAESPLVEELAASPRLHVRALAKFPLVAARGVTRLLLAPLKALWMFFTLLFTLLFSVPRPNALLLQNPPSIPTLLVCLLVARLRRAKLIVDWHNFGFSIVALSFPPHLSVVNAVVVGLCKWYERFFGRLADAHVCVSDAMRAELVARWNIPRDDIVVLHDCPPEFFHRASAEEKRDLFAREPLTSLFAQHKVQHVAVTATSFTKDEKLDMLLQAVQEFDERAHAVTASFPHVAFVVTGKGDMRAAFEERASQLKLRHCSVHVTYFDRFADYALMLGSSDVGLSFHASSSGLDLPMKVVDMFGCGLPVCSINYACISELVKDNVNGKIFEDPTTLATLLCSFFRPGLSGPDGQLARLRQGVKIPSWDETWNKHFKRIILSF